MKIKQKLLLATIIAPVLFICTMIDTRGEEKMGTCEIDGYSITPVANHDCKGDWHESK